MSAATTSRVALITGAAGGLGRALVEELLAQGWRVGAGIHQSAPFPAQSGLLPLPLDVTQEAQVDTALDRLLAEWGRLDLLVNNAGVTADRLLAQMPLAEWDRVLAVNLKGAFLCSRAAMKVMCRRRDGHILNISSFAARTGTVGQANYAAAKAGLLGLTQSLAREAGPRNVRVNAVLPGVLPTPMTRRLGEPRLAELARTNLLGRLNSLGEVARFVVFLAGTQNISGQVFQLDSRIAAWT